MNLLLTRPLNQTPMLIPNIGLGYLATACRTIGHEVAIIDCIRDGMTAADFQSDISGKPLDLIGFQIYTFDVPVMQPYLESCRRAKPDAVLIAGGPHPTALPEETLDQFPMLDAVFVSEAETGLPELCRLIDVHGSRIVRRHLNGVEVENQAGASIGLENVPGLVRRLDRTHYFRVPPQLVADLDATGFPSWDLLSPHTYPPAPQGTFTRRLPVAPMIVTRGCPFECTFCGGNLIAGKRLRFRSAANVVDEMEYLRDRFGIREIHIEDDNFSLNGKLVRQICEEMLRRKLDLTWSCPNGLRIDSLDDRLIKLMDEAGCYSLALGIESGSQRVLDLMKKRLNLERVKLTIEMIRRNSSIRITGFFMLGFPGETLEEMKETIRFAQSLDLDKVNYGAFMPLPGTEAFNDLRGRGLLEKLDYSRITEYRVPFSFGPVPAKKLRFLLQWAFFRFYFRPRIITSFLREIQSIHQVRVLGKRFLEVFWR
jgi:anaerobic magnesium-protoporphyrin IX monomethyl ester cyclase